MPNDRLSMQNSVSPAPIPRHPARYSDVLLPHMARMLSGCKSILDPFGGVGGVFRLALWLPDAQINAVEIETEWCAADPRMTHGNALHLPWPDATFDAICTSPTYGNRMADHHDARDGSRRNTYRHALGRSLSSENSGNLQWGDSYREFHALAWAEARRVLVPGGVFVLNCKDHIRRGVIQRVTDWHISELERNGFSLIDQIDVPVPGQRFGANGHLRVEHETIAALKLSGGAYAK